MSRPWPQPYLDRDRVIQVIGDTHIGTTAVNRIQKAVKDMVNGSMLPTPTCALHVGDIDDPGSNAQDVEAKGYLDQLPWPYMVNYGEHDNFNAVRTDAEWISFWGLPGRVHSTDFGWFRAIAIPTDPTQGEIDQVGALASASSLPCVVLSHRPLKGSLPGGTSPTYGAQPDTNGVGLYNANDDAYRAMLNANPIIKLVVCGHTHGAVDALGNASLVSVGTRNVIQVNAGALAYTNTTKGATSDYLPGVYITWRTSTNSVEVRFRDHGAGVWIFGPGNQKVITVAIP